MFDSITSLPPARIAQMPLKEIALHLARERMRQGLSPIDLGGMQRVLESDTGEIVRESASTSDLPNLVANFLYNRLDEWFGQYTPTWMDWAHQEVLQDYIVHNIFWPSEAEDPLPVFQASDYQDSGLTDKNWTIQLQKFGRTIRLPFQVIENDHKGYIASMPKRMIRACQRGIAKKVVQQGLEANLNAYDGLPTFSASRANALAGGSTITGNLVSGAGSAFSSANVQAGIAAVNSYIGDLDLNPSGVPLSAPAVWLVVPPSLTEVAAKELHSTILIAAGTASPISTQGNLNPLQLQDLNQILQLRTERYLTNPTAWYILPEADEGPLAVGVREARRLRPRLWQNAPQRLAIGGYSADDYLLLQDDMVYGYSYDLAVAA